MAENYMQIMFGSENGSFSEQLEGFAEYAKAKADEVFKSVVIQIGASVINLSPVDTGRFLANWQFTIGAPANTSLDEKDQDSSKTLARFISEVRPLTYGQTAYIVNNLVYAIPLEYGHSRQAPSGMVRITLARFQEIVNKALEEHSQ